MLSCNQELFARQGVGLWAVRQRTAPALCGFGGYWHFREPPELELVLGLRAESWHQGFATEAGRALIRHGFDLGFTEIRGSTDAANESSVRLMQRLGMEYEKRAVASGLDTIFYRVRRPGRDSADPMLPQDARTRQPS
jgi:RimJ/RimL family protein N-acetyltransferase